jgi:photosystem II stability/assembly factor-like uncharacterized protein
MKYFKHIVIGLVLTATLTKAQPWDVVLHVTTPNTFTPLMVADANSILAGTRKSANAGASWNPYTMTTGNHSVKSGQFLNQNNGIVLAMASPSGTALVLRTTNGGLSWTLKTPATFTTNPVAQNFFTMSTGYALTSTGAFLKTSDSGNTWQAGGSIGISGTALFFTSLDTGFALGHGPTIYRTVNGGATWTSTTTTATGSLRAVHFPTKTTGYVVGDSGIILKTTNGGATWNEQSHGVHPHLLDIHFYGPDTGYAVGYAGTILKTTNGGALWTPQASGTTRKLHAVRWSEPGVAFTVADSGMILRTGVPSGVVIPPSGLNYPRAQVAIYVVGSPMADTPIVLGTLPTFTIVPSLPPGLTLNNSNGIISGTPAATATQGTQNYVVTASNPAGSSKDTLNISIAFAPPSDFRYYYPNPRTWAVGVPILENTAVLNGYGVTFSASPPLPAGITLNSATGSITGTPTAVSPQTVHTVIATNPGGSDSVTLNYGVGINAWDSLVTGVPEQTLLSVLFTDSSHGYVGGFGNILKTVNAGASWQKVTAGDREIQAIALSSQNTGYAVSNSGTILLKTTTAGTSWTSEATVGSGSPTALATIQTAPGDAIFIGTRSSILKTVNAGVSWSPYTTPVTPIGFRFTNANRGYALGHDGTVFRTADAGQTWISSPSTITATLAAAHFADSSNWIAVGAGGKIVRTTNGGASWSTIGGTPAKALTSLAFLDTLTGWAVGDSGLILQTLDGGTTWSQMVTGRAVPFHAITVAPGGKRYVTGAGGVLLVNDSIHLTSLSPYRVMSANRFTATYRSGTLILSNNLDAPTPLIIRVLDARGRVRERMTFPLAPVGHSTIQLPLKNTGSDFLILDIRTNTARYQVKVPPQ